MAKKATNPLRPEIGRRYRLRCYLGGERIADVIEIDRYCGLIDARDPDGHVYQAPCRVRSRNWVRRR